MSTHRTLAAAFVMTMTALVGADSSTSRGREARVAEAAQRGDLSAIRLLLQQGADVNGSLGDGMTALHWAAAHGDGEMAGVLLAARAAVGAGTRIGQHTPLHVAAKAGHGAVVRLLVEAGADVRARTTTGATALHLAAASGARDAVELLIDRGAEVDVREPQWGQTPLMFAAASGRTDVVKALLARGADPRLTGTVVDVSARNRADGVASRERNARVAAIQRERAAATAAAGFAPEPAAYAAQARAVRGADNQEEPEPLGYADLVGTHGGLTPLLLAAREGLAETALALVEGGADLNQVSAADRTSPVLMATINGHFDLAMQMVARGADVTRASDAGATPLYGVLNMQWAPKSRHPQPADYMQQQVHYLDLAEALLKAGADPDVRLNKSLWYTTYNRDLLGVDRTGATPFWRAAHALDIPAMKLLLRYGADSHIPTAKVPERFEDVDTSAADVSGLPPIPMFGPAVAPIHAASGAGWGLGYAGNSHRHVPEGWLPAVKFLVEELGADVNARDHHGYTPVHHAAARGDNTLILYLVSKGADPKAVSRTGQTTVDMANGPVQRVQPFPETIELLVKLGAKNNNRCVSC
ncbi:MAG: ankyrin repeat domain-containing protein [Acidobacteriota bacterium]